MRESGRREGNEEMNEWEIKGEGKKVKMRCMNMYYILCHRRISLDANEH